MCITIISKFNVGQKIYKKFSDRIVPGIIISIIFDGNKCNYEVRFADEERDIYADYQFCLDENEICFPIEVVNEDDEEDDDDLKRLLNGN